MPVKMWLAKTTVINDKVTQLADLSCSVTIPTDSRLCLFHTVKVIWEPYGISVWPLKVIIVGYQRDLKAYFTSMSFLISGPIHKCVRRPQRNCSGRIQIIGYDEDNVT